MYAKAQKQLRTYIARYVSLSDAEFQQFYKALDLITIEKKKHLFKEGDFCTKQFFLLEGLLRMYHTDAEGNERIELFVIENWWVTHMDSFVNGVPSNVALQALETSQLLVLEKTKLEALFVQIPSLERLFRKITEGLYIATQRKYETYMKLTSKARYESLVTSFPDFAQRVPQYMIASYLNMSPEYLSDIRKSI